jgi:hypothetical protein
LPFEPSGPPLASPPSPVKSLPPSTDGELPHGPQIPRELPADRVHDVPGQQSADVVQAPQLPMHIEPAQTKGGPASGAPGTQGRPPQQLALDAHAWPAPTHVPAHLGTPTLSCLQVSSVSQLPEQQSQDELQDIVCSLHTSPSGLHPIGNRQTPTVAGAVMTHVTGLPDPPGKPAEPQQSLSAVHRSPTTWQPLAGWQTKTPVGPQGAQARLQHEPPHRGTPPSMIVPPWHKFPSVTPQLAGPPGGAAAHVPSAFPAGTSQPPLQQSFDDAHASPGWPQNEDAWQ